MQQLPKKAYFTPEEAAEYLSVTADTIRKLCRRNEIPGARLVGRQWRIPRSYLAGDPLPEKIQQKETDT